jgi:hypothetical protein
MVTVMSVCRSWVAVTEGAAMVDAESSGKPVAAEAIAHIAQGATVRLVVSEPAGVSSAAL